MRGLIVVSKPPRAGTPLIMSTRDVVETNLDGVEFEVNVPDWAVETIPPEETQNKSEPIYSFDFDESYIVDSDRYKAFKRERHVHNVVREEVKPDAIDLNEEIENDDFYPEITKFCRANSLSLIEFRRLLLQRVLRTNMLALRISQGVYIPYECSSEEWCDVCTRFLMEVRYGYSV